MMSSIALNFQNFKISIVAPVEHIELIKEYLPQLTCASSDSSEYEIKVIVNNNLNFIVPKNFLVKKLFSGQTYFVWKDKQYIIGLAQASKNCARHMIRIIGKKFIIQVPDMKNMNYIICVIREILFKNLLSSGYIPMHASAVVLHDKAYCFFGAKNSGKSICFFSAVDKGGFPLSNDLVFIKKLLNKWIVVGWPFAPSINKKFFDSDYTGSEKVKFTPKKFCDMYNTSWVWECELKNLIFVNFQKSKEVRLEQLEPDDLRVLMQNYATEERWIWEDAFGLGEEFPKKIDYTKVSSEISGLSLTGNIFKIFEDLKKGELYV